MRRKRGSSPLIRCASRRLLPAPAARVAAIFYLRSEFHTSGGSSSSQWHGKYGVRIFSFRCECTLVRRYSWDTSRTESIIEQSSPCRGGTEGTRNGAPPHYDGRPQTLLGNYGTSRQPTVRTKQDDQPQDGETALGGRNSVIWIDLIPPDGLG
eukprot:scaffold21833_cov152-Isochrysis_galbana.AAC.1